MSVMKVFFLVLFAVVLAAYSLGVRIESEWGVFGYLIHDSVMFVGGALFLFMFER